MSCHNLQESEPVVKRFRRGDVREDGKIFWAYKKDCVNGECWYSGEQFQRQTEQRKRREKNRVRSPEARARHRAAQKRWKKRNPKAEIERRRKRRKRRLSCDPMYSLGCRLRKRIKEALTSRGLRKRLNSTSILGCSWKSLRGYIESLFEPGMSWDNRGRWHIDHIVPLAAAKNEQDVIELNHYSNLRPLWSVDNIRKSSTLPNREQAPRQLWRFLPEE